MISNQILQSTIDGLKGITRVDLCIIDTEGKVLATTFPDADKYIGPAAAFVESPADSQVVQGCQFFKVFDEHQLEYILLANALYSEKQWLRVVAYHCDGAAEYRYHALGGICAKIGRIF